MEKKENQRVMLTKRLLKESLLQLMSEKSIQKISVSELCDASGINRSTFYNHYGSPYDVLREMELDVINDLKAIDEKENSGSTCTLDQRIESLCAYLQKHKALSKILFRNSDTDSEFATLLFHAAHVRIIYENIFSDVENEDSRDLMITFLTNGAYHMIRQWLLNDMKKTPKEMGELVYQMASHGWEHFSL